MNPLIPGFGLIFLAAVAGGAFAVPLRMRRRYEWENTWLLGFLFALIIIPLIVVSIFLPVWPSAIEGAGLKTVLTALTFGFLWGCGAVTFAIGISSIGLSLGYATIMGIATAVGSVIPMVRRWDSAPNEGKLAILFGIAVCIVGTALCGKAGMLRERAAGAAVGLSTTKNSAVRVFVIGLLWCILSGLLSACANLGFDFADKVADEAIRLGAHPLAASIGRWIAMYWGGFLAILIGTGSAMLRKGTWKNYVGRGATRDFGLAVALGCLHFFAQIPYGMGAYYLGRFGTTVGWAVNITFSLLVANTLGFITREWMVAPRSSVKTLYLGLCVLVVAMIILAYGNSLVNRATLKGEVTRASILRDKLR